MAVSISTTHATMRTAASDTNAAVDRWSARIALMIQRPSPRPIVRMRSFSELSVGRYRVISGQHLLNASSSL
jgi:hypothetical protein